ncbi:MAG TPA: hypothetical protein PK771_15305 [Spirochaetota bacterium]|nr:hypothetical protein [Spirochaetota bacterium]
MIKKFTIDNKNDFSITGIFDKNSIDIRDKEAISGAFYKDLISKMMTIKKTILKNYYDDGKLIGEERFEIINTINEFLTFFSILSLIQSNNENFFQGSIGNIFQITINITGVNSFAINGSMPGVTGKDITDYEEWFDSKIVENFKSIIALSKDLTNREQIQKRILEIFYNLLVLRYKIEFY